MYQIWKAHSDKVRTSSWEEQRTTELAEGQFQFSMRSHRKEGSFQVFCIQVTPEAFWSHSLSFSSGYIQRHRISTTAADPVLDQCQQMRSKISTFLGARQDPTPSPRQSFCNYLHSEIEHLEERDFLTFSNDTVKLLSEIQYKAEECKRQVTTSQQVITFQLPEAIQATAGREYILTIPETQAVSIPVVHWNDQQPGTPRQMIFNPPSVAASHQEERQHFRIIQSLWSYSKCATVSSDGHTTAIFTLSTSNSTVTSAIFHSSWTVTTSQPVHPAESAQISGLACTSRTKTSPSKGHSNHPQTINKLNVYAQKQKKHTVQHLHFPTVHKKMCEWMVNKY